MLIQVRSSFLKEAEEIFGTKVEANDDAEKGEQICITLEE